MAATAAMLARPIRLTFLALVILRSVMRNYGVSKWLVQPPLSRVAPSQIDHAATQDALQCHHHWKRQRR